MELDYGVDQLWAAGSLIMLLGDAAGLDDLCTIGVVFVRVVFVRINNH